MKMQWQLARYSYPTLCKPRLLMPNNSHKYPPIKITCPLLFLSQNHTSWCHFLLEKHLCPSNLDFHYLQAMPRLSLSWFGGHFLLLIHQVQRKYRFFNSFCSKNFKTLKKKDREKNSKMPCIPISLVQRNLYLFILVKDILKAQKIHKGYGLYIKMTPQCLGAAQPKAQA